MTMISSPGLLYLLRVLPLFLIPTITTYLLLTLAKEDNIIDIPLWSMIAIALLSRPAIFIGTKIFSRWYNSRKAAAQGAVVAPYVAQSPFSNLKELKHMVQGHPAEAFLRWTHDHGNVVQADLFSNTVLVTNEPEHVKAILATQFTSFGKGPVFMEKMKSLLGSGIFNVNGDMWKFHRGITRPFFSRERVSDFEIYDRNCDMSLALAQRRLNEGHSVDVQDLFGRFTLDSATEFLFGQSVGSLSADLPYPPKFSDKNTDYFYNHPSNVFVNAFSEGLDISEHRSRSGALWQLFEFSKDQVKPLREIMDNFTKPLIEQALTKRDILASGKSEESPSESVLSHLVQQTQDPQVIKDELINLLVAGRDTTMGLLTFSVYMLSQHVDIEKRLRREIFDVVGPTGAPDYSQIHAMKYLRAFLNEVLRLYPSVPTDSRTCSQDVILPSTKSTQTPIFVPKGTDCIYPIMNIHRRKDLWGPDALEFDPDRFLDERLNKYLTPNPFIFCPFNAGPRICLGQQFAYHEASFYLVRLLQKFTGFTLDDSSNVSPPAEWANGDGRKPIEKVHPVVHLTMYVKGGLWVHMKEIKSSDVF